MIISKHFQVSDDVNHLLLDNKELRREVEDLRKQKIICSNQLEQSKVNKVNLEVSLKQITEDNNYNLNDVRGMICNFCIIKTFISPKNK